MILVLGSRAGLAADHEGQIAGTVEDVTGSLVQGARITLRTPQRATIATGITDADGAFNFDRIPFGSYEVAVSAPGFAEPRVAVEVTSTAPVHVRVRLEPGLISEEITVMADGGLVRTKRDTVQPVNIIGARELAERAKVVLVQAVDQEAGLSIQRTSPTIGGVFIRGLTGNKVNVFVDGVRYSNSAARGGINTFLDLVDSTSLAAIEVIRGPKSADYGSDAIGGSLQLISHAPTFGPSHPELHGSWVTFFNSADLSFGSSMRTSLAMRTFGFTSNFVGRRINTLRPGDGLDSRSVVTRFLGLPSSIVQGTRLPDTAFTQYGGLVGFSWSPRPTHLINVHYQRGQQDGGKRYDQLLGGDGNLIADLRNLMLDFLYVRYDRQRVGWFDSLSLTYSHNAQREERVNQGGNGNPLGAVTHQYEKTRASGVQVRGYKVWRGHQLRLGSEFYHEGIDAPSFSFDPAANRAELSRPRIPDGARYLHWGVYAQEATDFFRARVRFVGGLRYSGASYRARAEDSPVVNGKTLWPDDSARVDDVTGQVGALVRLTERWGASFQFSRGFRAPHMTDLGTLGLTGSGFEVAAPDVVALGGLIGSTADSQAVSTGRPVEQLNPEVSFNYDAGLRYYQDRVQADLHVFVNDIDDIIEKQTLILPAGAVGKILGGESIIDQTPTGAVFVAASPNPVLVRANFGDVRLWGIEQTFDVTLTPTWSVRGAFTYIRAENKETGAPPNIEGGTPPATGYLHLRYSPSARFWIEPYVHLSDRQDRLSSLDLSDRRTGASRSLGSIARFFRNGATVRGLIGPGPDRRLGTSDDLLLATGETLAEVQRRVLGPGVSEAPLFPALPGYVTVNIRGGVDLTDSQRLTVEIENLMDHNYRGVSWGIDGSGRSVSFRYELRF